MLYKYQAREATIERREIIAKEETARLIEKISAEINNCIDKGMFFLVYKYKFNFTKTPGFAIFRETLKYFEKLEYEIGYDCKRYGETYIYEITISW